MERKSSATGPVGLSTGRFAVAGLGCSGSTAGVVVGAVDGAADALLRCRRDCGGEGGGGGGAPKNSPTLLIPAAAATAAARFGRPRVFAPALLRAAAGSCGGGGGLSFKMSGGRLLSAGSEAFSALLGGGGGGPGGRGGWNSSGATVGFACLDALPRGARTSGFAAADGIADCFEATFSADVIVSAAADDGLSACVFMLVDATADGSGDCVASAVTVTGDGIESAVGSAVPEGRPLSREDVNGLSSELPSEALDGKEALSVLLFSLSVSISVLSVLSVLCVLSFSAAFDRLASPSRERRRRFATVGGGPGGRGGAIVCCKS